MHAPLTMDVGDDKDFHTETLSLYRINGVAGLLLLKGRNMLANHMPFSDQRTVQLGDHIRKMTEGYTSVGRSMRQMLVMYDAGALLIISHSDSLLALLLTGRAELDVVSNAATVFMAEHRERLLLVSAEKQKNSNLIQDPLAPREVVVTGSRSASARMVENTKPEISRWPEIRKHLEGILGKAMGRAQINNLISRVSTQEGVEDPFQLSGEKARKLAMQVLDQIPNRSRRASLVSELESIFQENNL